MHFQIPFSASLINLSQEAIGLISPVNPTSPIITVLLSFNPAFFTLDNSANANPKSPVVPSKVSPPTTFT